MSHKMSEYVEIINKIKNFQTKKKGPINLLFYDLEIATLRNYLENSVLTKFAWKTHHRIEWNCLKSSVMKITGTKENVLKHFSYHQIKSTELKCITGIYGDRCLEIFHKCHYPPQEIT